MGNTVCGDHDSAQKFLNFGFDDAIVTLIASILLQLVALAFSIIAFLDNPVTYILPNIPLLLSYLTSSLDPGSFPSTYCFPQNLEHPGHP